MTPAEAAAIREGECCVGLIKLKQHVTDHDTQYTKDVTDIWAAVDDIRGFMRGILVSTAIGALAFVGGLIMLILRMPK